MEMTMAYEDKLYTGDCVKAMEKMPKGVVNLAFCDPPYNIGYDYHGEYDDELTPGQYAEWSQRWIVAVRNVLTDDGSFWLAIGDEWAAELKLLCRECGFHMRSWIVWYYTFGVNSTKKFTRSHAHLLYFTKHKKNFVFNIDQIRVPSSRTLVYKDKRANPRGRLPDDTWILRPQELGVEAFPEHGNTWHIPRVCGTFKQRIKDAPNQMPEQLIGRIIRACSNPGDLVLDPMAGTGTTLAVAKKLDRRYLGFEASANFADVARHRIAGATVGEELDGPIPQGSH
jgi:site-specific DNA-methyltransferase (adenine-specific)